MSEASTDHGTILPKESFAIVWSKLGGFELLVPDLPPESVMPPEALVLTGLFVRLHDDDDFRGECMKYFMDAPA